MNDETQEFVIRVPATITFSVRAWSAQEAATIAAWLLREGAGTLFRDWRGIDSRAQYDDTVAPTVEAAPVREHWLGEV